MYIVIILITVYSDCSIRVYRSFTENFHKCINIAINAFYTLPIMLALCLMVSLTHYAQNYAGIIGGSLATAVWRWLGSHMLIDIIVVKSVAGSPL